MKYLFIVIFALQGLKSFSQVDTNENYSKEEIEKIVKEIRLIYNFYEINSETIHEIGDGIGIYNNSIFRSQVPVPGIGSEDKSMIWYHLEPHVCPGDFYALVTNFGGPYEGWHEEFIKYKSPDCLMMEQSDPPFNELKYFGDKESIGLIFYFKEYNFQTPAVVSDQISISTRAYYYKNKLIKVILKDKIENLKEVYYYPFKGMEKSILNKLQNIKCPEPY